VSRAHVDVAARCLQRIPSQLRAKHRDKLAEFFDRQSRSFPANDCDRLARQLLATIDPDRTDRYDPHAHERRSLSAVFDSTGMLLLRGQLDPAAAGIVKAAVDHYAAPRNRAATPASNPIPIEASNRTRISAAAGQRYADALSTSCQLAMAADRGPAPGAANPPGSWCTPPRNTSPVFPAPAWRSPTAARHWPPAHCTASAATPSSNGSPSTAPGRVLNSGRSIRLATPAQRHALAGRDGGCAHPDCSAPPAWCDAHHIDWWTHGGPTDLDNLCLLCTHHHTPRSTPRPGRSPCGTGCPTSCPLPTRPHPNTQTQHPPRRPPPSPTPRHPHTS
jgi:Domain of unknown function (DUF222)